MLSGLCHTDSPDKKTGGCFIDDRLTLQDGFPEITEWEALLDELAESSCLQDFHFPISSIYHSPQFVECLKRAEIPCHGLQLRKKGKLCALAVVIEDHLFPLHLIGQKGFCPAGLLAKGSREKSLLYEGLRERFTWKQLYLEAYEPKSCLEPDSRPGLSKQDYMNYFIDLRCSYEDIHRKYNRSLKRNIRQAGTSMLRLREVRTRGDLKATYRLLLQTSHRVGAPPVPWPLYREVFQHLVPAGLAVIYMAEVPYGQAWRAVNTRVELLYRGVSIDWFTGSDEGSGQAHTGAWLVDQVLHDLKARGVQTFDFGGAGRVGEKYGPAEFKRRFGGAEVPIHRFVDTYHPRLKSMARGIYRFWRMVSSRITGRSR